MSYSASPFVQSGINPVVDLQPTPVPVGDLGLGRGKTPQQFGAKADGVTNDTSAIQQALNAAAAEGIPCHIPAGTYIAEGLTIPSGLRHVTGDGNDLSIIKRIPNAVSNSSILSANGRSNFSISDVGFDGNKEEQTMGSNNLTFTNCFDFQLRRVRSVKAKKASGYGTGIILNLLPTTNTTGREVLLEGCEGYQNDEQGVAILRTGAAISILGGVYSENNSGGIDYYDQAIAPATNTVPNFKIANVRCERNGGSGIVIRGFMVPGINGARTYGHGYHPVHGLTITGCHCNNNNGYGIFAQAAYVTISNNVTRNNGSSDQAGICCNSEFANITNNLVAHNRYFGIDAGGSIHSTVSHNIVAYTDDGTGNGTGINLGACQHVICSNNSLLDNGLFQIYVPRYDAGLFYFNWETRNVIIDGNTIVETRSDSNFGIATAGIPDDVTITNNLIEWPSTDGYNAIRAGMNKGIIRGNRKVSNTLNALVANASSTITYPEWCDAIAINSDTTPIVSLQSRTQQLTVGRITGVHLTNRGSGYTSDFTVGVIGGGGTGAVLTAKVSQDGQVAAIRIDNGGSGFTSTPTLDFSAGNGTGVAATVFVGTPPLNGRELTFLAFASPFRMQSGDTINLPCQDNATIIVGNRGALTLVRAEDRWYPKSFASGDGTVYPTMVQYANGPVSLAGPGSPQNVITAPVGSMYFRTDGGAGSTLYVKESGSGNTGWVAK
jgi:hypothetical protein